MIDQVSVKAEDKPKTRCRRRPFGVKLRQTSNKKDKFDSSCRSSWLRLPVGTVPFEERFEQRRGIENEKDHRPCGPGERLKECTQRRFRGRGRAENDVRRVVERRTQVECSR